MQTKEQHRKATEERIAKAKARLAEAIRVNDERMAEWPKWLKDAAALSPVFTTE